MKHTPGPWAVSATRTHVLRDHPRETICSVFGGHESMGRHVTSETQEANAHLIAAAPELLDALRGMQKASEEIAVEFIEHKRATNWGIVNDAYIAAARAIAKAEGR